MPADVEIPAPVNTAIFLLIPLIHTTATRPCFGLRMFFRGFFGGRMSVMVWWRRVAGVFRHADGIVCFQWF